MESGHKVFAIVAVAYFAMLTCMVIFGGGNQ